MTTAPRSGGCLQWFCVATNHGQQFLAESSLASAGWRTVFPLHLERQKPPKPDKIGPLFPGYGFVSVAPDQDYAGIYRARGVYRLLGKVGAYGPHPIPSEMIDDLIARMSARRIIDDPGQARGSVYLAPATRVRVVDGPFRGWEGLCMLSAPSRLRVLLALFGGDREVEMRPDWVEAVHASSH